MLFAPETVHIFAFLCRISDKPVARYWDIADCCAGLRGKGHLVSCPIYAAGGLMESEGLAGEDALQPEQLGGKVR